MLSLVPGSYNRPSFRGYTDSYAGRSGQRFAPKFSAKYGQAEEDLGLNLVAPSIRRVALQRIGDYLLRKRFYDGHHYDYPYDGSREKLIINFCRKVVDIGVDFFIANGWASICPSGNEAVAELLNCVWEDNSRLKVTNRLCTQASISGESFLYVTVQTTDDAQLALPKDKWKTRLIPVNPAFVIPVWNPRCPDHLMAATVQFPFIDQTDDTEHLTTLYITPQKWELYRDDKKISEDTNPFGMVNLVHVPNTLQEDNPHGYSDLDSIIPLNKELNDVTNRIGRIIEYHGEPTTLIFGAKASDLERGANKVWSNLPVDGRVENLKLDSDLKAVMEYRNTLREELASLADIPLFRLITDDTKAVSNMSGLAMAMRFQPLVDKTRRKRIGFSSAVSVVNELILLAHQRIIGDDILQLVDDPKQLYVSTPCYTSALPRDEITELNAGKLKVDMRVWSVVEAQRHLSGVSDFERLALEVAADERKDLVLNYEKQLGLQGTMPNLSSVFLGSSMLAEDLSEVASESAS